MTLYIGLILLSPDDSSANQLEYRKIAGEQLEARGRAVKYAGLSCGRLWVQAPGLALTRKLPLFTQQ